ncbi:hypothetical protein HYW35_03145 [Candidatus Saccharibacteria bacterium]|nr:hypothetical protein [Candidatus Saccharibacteria bacterium]
MAELGEPRQPIIHNPAEDSRLRVPEDLGQGLGRSDPIYTGLDSIQRRLREVDPITTNKGKDDPGAAVRSKQTKSSLVPPDLKGNLEPPVSKLSLDPIAEPDLSKNSPIDKPDLTKNPLLDLPPTTLPPPPLKP